MFAFSDTGLKNRVDHVAHPDQLKSEVRIAVDLGL